MLLTEKKKTGEHATLWREKAYNFLGFTIFDVIHSLALVILILLFLEEPSETRNNEIAYQIVELIFAAVLIAFVDALAEKDSNADLHEIRNYYTFAWIIVTAAILVPNCIPFPNRLAGNVTTIDTLFFFKLGFAFLGFVCILSTMLMDHHLKLWKTFLLIGILCIDLSIPFAIAEQYFPYHGAISVLETITALAPLAPTVFALLSFRRFPAKEEN
ncbi:MAG: hypothetical protein PUC66_02185 [Erysipelotrichaceae bacterium]|nr:hypothetical protein [Erysipelotrichaceae bacterium]